MSEIEIRQRAASEGQRGGRRGQEGWPSPLYRASWSTVKTGPLFVLRFYSPVFCQELSSGANGPTGPNKKQTKKKWSRFTGRLSNYIDKSVFVHDFMKLSLN